MTNTCPKCGAEQTEIHGLYKCGTQKYNNPENNADIFFPYSVSNHCRGRAEAIAELDAWHTGEPPEGVSRVIVRLKGLDGQYGYDYAWLDCRGDGLWYWSAGDRSGKWCDYWQWREVRP